MRERERGISDQDSYWIRLATFINDSSCHQYLLISVEFSSDGCKLDLRMIIDITTTSLTDYKLPR